jgi:hypothetical protein
MNLSHSLRVIHRNLGFLAVGLSLVYGVSGVVLNHLGEKDPAFRTVAATLQLPPHLTESELQTAWATDGKRPAVKRIRPVDEVHYRLFLDGGIGVYNAANGVLDYETHRRNHLVYYINRLHYSKAKGWRPIADTFAVSLIVLAVTGLFIVKGKKGIAGAGKWYLLAGVLIPILFIALFMR